MKLPVSVQVITLNEAENIAECLESVNANSPAEVLVVDGGSEDDTVNIARGCGARVLTPGRLGRGASRHLGFSSTAQPYVAMVDADDRISRDWLTVCIKELEAGGYAALQSSLRVLKPRTFWERGWDQYFIESIRPVADTIMVGHPALYRTDALLGSRDDIGHDHEDTQLSVDFVQRGLRQGIGTAVSYRVVPSDWQENAHKWTMYGKGYRDFVRRHPERRGAILRHILITIPFVRGWRPVRRGAIAQPVFATAMALCILRGYLLQTASHA